jgi:hypothetical protein
LQPLGIGADGEPGNLAVRIDTVFAQRVAEQKSPSEPMLEVAIFLPRRSSGLLISGLTTSLLLATAMVWATLTKSAPLRSANMTCGSATGAAKRLPPNSACELWPDPRSKTISTSSPFFSYIFASLAIHGIHMAADNAVIPQLIFFTGRSCARLCALKLVL